MKQWMRRILQASAIAAILPATAATAQQKVPSKQPARTVAKSPQDALFAKYTALDAPATRERLAALKKDPAKAKLVAKVSDALAAPKVKAADIESDMLALVKGLDPKEIDLVLDAVMRDHYDRHIATRSKALSASAAGKELERKDHALEAGVYGKATHKKHHIRAKRRHVRR